MNDYITDISRIEELRLYLINVIDELTNNSNFQINADMLSKNVGDYSLDRIPSQSVVSKWLIGTTKRKDLYSFRSRKAYSQDSINNLENIGFFEKFEDIIKEKNLKGELPDIDDIESIECVNTGTMRNANTNTAEFDIQIQITYRKEA